MSSVSHRCAVLGKPIAHSLSPVLHNAAYRALGLDDWAYGRYEVGADDLGGFLASLDRTWVGLSLTMPLKKTIQPYGTPCDTWTKRLHVANTVIFDWSAAQTESQTDCEVKSETDNSVFPGVAENVDVTENTSNAEDIDDIDNTGIGKNIGDITNVCGSTNVSSTDNTANDGAQSSVLSQGTLPKMRLYNTDVLGIVLAFAHARGTNVPSDIISDTHISGSTSPNSTSPNSTAVSLTSSSSTSANSTSPNSTVPHSASSNATSSDSTSSDSTSSDHIAVVLGNGNTAMSAVAACTMMTDPIIGHIIVAARHPDRNAEELRNIAHGTGRTLDVIALSDAPDALRQADTVISTLPAHAADPLAASLADNKTFSSPGMLLDVVYDPRPTDLMSAWSSHGLPTIGGQEMLLYQAIAQVRLMTGLGEEIVDVIEEPMRKALEEVL